MFSTIECKCQRICVQPENVTIQEQLVEMDFDKNIS